MPFRLDILAKPVPGRSAKLRPFSPANGYKKRGGSFQTTLKARVPEKVWLIL
jgi:hypothetical protein